MSLEDVELIVRILFLLFLANGTPVIVKWILGARLAFPIDGGKKFIDGRPWFGPAKTVRGIVLSLIVTSIGAVLIGYSLQTGVLFAAASLIGDLFSSFIKRRLGLRASSRALVLDQLPETVLPLIICWNALNLDLTSTVVIVIVFFVLEIVLSKLLYRLHIRERPY
jgi:hypothetical protein